MVACDRYSDSSKGDRSIPTTSESCRLVSHQMGLTLWAWELTGSATALALVSFFFLLPRIFVSLFAGIIVERANRKHLMILGDALAASSTLGILILYLSGNLAIWHLYLAASINGGFGQIQQLAYSTSITLLVSPQNYTRANSMNSVVHYGSNIIAPAIAIVSSDNRFGGYLAYRSGDLGNGDR